jgi:hypothetical protein
VVQMPERHVAAAVSEGRGRQRGRDGREQVGVADAGRTAADCIAAAGAPWYPRHARTAAGQRWCAPLTCQPAFAALHVGQLLA